MKTIIFLITLTLFSYAGVIDQLINKLDDGYQIRINATTISLFRVGCDIINYDKASFTPRQLKMIKKVYQLSNRNKKKFRQRMVTLFKRTIKNINPKEGFIHFYFLVSKVKALQGAKTGLLGLDSAQVEESRHRIDRKAIVYETKIIESDTTKIKKQFDLNNIKMPTWKYSTKKQLITFLGNPANGWSSNAGL